MARVSSKKKVGVSRKKAASSKRTKKTAVRRATKKRAVRRVSGPATRTGKLRLSKKTAVKRNPTRTRYWLQVGNKYFDGGGLTNQPLNAVYFDSKKQAAKIAVKLANASGRSVSVHSNQRVKKN